MTKAEAETKKHREEAIEALKEMRDMMMEIRELGGYDAFG